MCFFIGVKKVMGKKQIIDVTGTPLRPSKQGRKCLGNGEHSEFECCCDGCDYFLKCFPDKSKTKELKKWLNKFRK